MDCNKKDPRRIEAMLEECLNPELMVKRLAECIFTATGRRSGHIHFRFKGKDDHLVFIWSKGALREIVTKTSKCKEGEYISQKHSEFCNEDFRNILEKRREDIAQIEIDKESFSKTWASYNEFITWLAAFSS